MAKNKMATVRVRIGITDAKDILRHSCGGTGPSGSDLLTEKLQVKLFKQILKQTGKQFSVIAEYNRQNELAWKIFKELENSQELLAIHDKHAPEMIRLRDEQKSATALMNDVCKKIGDEQDLHQKEINDYITAKFREAGVIYFSASIGGLIILTDKFPEIKDIVD